MVPDFIFDAARLFNIVLVGYSANDAPMRYLLNAVAADSSRFDDLKERFAFVGTTSSAAQITIEDWKGRGITPIPYDSAISHESLEKTLHQWAELSPHTQDFSRSDHLIKRIVRKPVGSATEAECDVIEHLIRRSSIDERLRMMKLMSNASAEPGWLDIAARVASEKGGETRQL